MSAGHRTGNEEGLIIYRTRLRGDDRDLKTAVLRVSGIAAWICTCLLEIFMRGNGAGVGVLWDYGVAKNKDLEQNRKVSVEDKQAQ